MKGGGKMIRIKSLLAILLIFLLDAGPVLGQEMTKSQLQKMYTNYLKAEGFSASLDEDGDVVFKYEGGNYYISVDESDLEFFSLYYPNFWELESDSEKAQAKTAALMVTNTTKIAKVFFTRNETQVSINAETLLTAPSDFKQVFKRMLSVIAAARGKFITEMQ
jgi:hypothetical protein